MGKSRKKDARGAKHGKGSYIPKTGRPKKLSGKTVSPIKAHPAEAIEKRLAQQKTRKLVAALALSSGESMDAGMARMALIVTLNLVDEADLTVTSRDKKVAGLHAVLSRAAALCSSTVGTVTNLFWSYLESDGASFNISDNSSRGRGSKTVDRASLYRVNEVQTKAIMGFIDYRHSATGAGKVSPPPPPL